MHLGDRTLAVSTKTRVAALAKELGITDRELVAKAAEHGITLAVFSRLDADQADEVRALFKTRKRAEARPRRIAGEGGGVVRRRARRTTDTMPAAEEPVARAPVRRVATPVAAPVEEQVEAAPEPEPVAVAPAPVETPAPVEPAPEVAPVEKAQRARATEESRVRRVKAGDVAAPSELQPKTMISAKDAREADEARLRAAQAQQDALQAESTAAATEESGLAAAGAAATRDLEALAAIALRERGPRKVEELDLEVNQIGRALDSDPTLPSQSRVPRLRRAKMPDALVNIPKPPVRPQPPATTERTDDASRGPRPPVEVRPGTAPAPAPDGFGARGRKVIYDRRRDGGRGFGDERRRGRKRRTKGKTSTQPVATVPSKAEKRHLKIEDTITVSNLAHQMSVKSTEVIKKLFDLGIMATINHTLDLDTVELVASEFGFTVENVAFDLESFLTTPEDAALDIRPRPPVVTVMGHVDHGKTTLLDRVRDARVAAREAGGITQHIGAYAVDLGEKGRVLFLDTPGHEAFTAMRARGAEATDIIVLVVAADDGVMPQTIEAINHARAANVPIIVAINKIDKPGADLDRVRRELAEQNLVVEEWGGDVTNCAVSAKTGEGVDELLETLALQSQVMELTAPVACDARGLVIEARLERGRGAVATLLIRKGTLNRGDYVVAGSVYGRVRAMHDDAGRPLEKATPDTPVEVLGLGGVAAAGDEFVTAPDEKSAKAIVDHRKIKSREREAAMTSKVTLDSMFAHMEAADIKELNLIIKADVHGSAEALKGSLLRLEHTDVKVRVLHSSVGGVTESDINLAAASGAKILAFNVKPEAKGKRLAEDLGVKIESFSVIYEAIDYVMLAMEGMLDPIEEELIHGHAEVRAVFHIAKAGSVAGCYITDGKLLRNVRMRLFRGDELMWTGKCSTLKRFKDDVAEVGTGYECGVALAGFGKVHVADRIECFEVKRTPRKLDLKQVYRPAPQAT